MEKNQYVIYLESTINLVRSILLVAKEIGEAINVGLVEKGVTVNTELPESWKYYLNLNGEYHEVDGEPIVIISRDTHEEIELTKENMEFHPITRDSLLPHTSDYRTLVETYPDLEILIRGIVTPIPYEVSLNVKDYTIVDWDSKLIQPNEHDLINRMQDYVNGFILRHHNTAYGVVDDLYLPTMLGTLYQYLLPIALNIRLSNCHTNRAHSFHVWSYLAGFGGLDRWRFSLSLDQSMYLYRNINWITSNVGSTDVFSDLTRVMLTAIGLPLYGYDLRHDDYDLIDRLKYESLATRYRIDETIDVANLSETKTIDELFSIIETSARDNPAVEPYSIDYVNAGMERSQINRMPTKVLESEIINSVDNEEVELTRTALTQWISMSASGHYNVSVEVTHREAGLNHIMKVSEVLVLYTYVAVRALADAVLIEIPNYKVWKARGVTDPTFEELRDLSNTLPDKWIHDIIAAQVDVVTVRSVADFSDFCINLRKSQTETRLMYSRLGTIDTRSQGELIFDAFWTPKLVNILDGTYRSFFDARGIDDSLLTREVCTDLEPLLYNLATGFDYNSDSTYTSVQLDMLQLMGTLSSYNVQYVGSQSYANAEPVRWCVFRQSNLTVDVGIGTVYHRLPNAIILMENVSSHDTSESRNLCVRTRDQMVNVTNTTLLSVVVRADTNQTVTVSDNISMSGFRVLKHEVGTSNG